MPVTRRTFSRYRIVRRLNFSRVASTSLRRTARLNTHRFHGYPPGTVICHGMSGHLFLWGLFWLTREEFEYRADGWQLLAPDGGRFTVYDTADF